MSEQLNPLSDKLQLEQVGVDLTVQKINEVSFPQETYEAISKLDNVLKRIDARMRSRGYTIVDGKLTKI